MRLSFAIALGVSLVAAGSCGESPSAPTRFAATARTASEQGSVAPDLSGVAAAAGAIGGGPLAPSCVSSVFLATQTFGMSGGEATATVVAPPTCSWHAASDQGFVTVPAQVRTGNGTFTITVIPSTVAFPREATVSVNNRSILITQLAKAQPPAPPPGVSTYFAVLGESGDYITRGRNRLDTRSNAAFEASVDAARTTVTIYVQPADGTWWYLHVSAPAGAQLAPGAYENVNRWPFYKPGLDYSGDGSGCNQLSGRFVIHEAVFSGATTVERLRISFEQHCEFRSVAAYGEVSLVAPFGPVAHTPQPPGHPPSPTPATTTFTLVSDTGDWVGGGQSATYTLANAAFSAATAGSGNLLTVQVTLPGPGNYWTINLKAPLGLPLAPGIYEGATRYPFQSPVAPGLSFSGMGRGCNTLTGQFVIYEIQFGPANSIDRLRATFEQHCEGKAPAARGDITIIGTPPR